MDDFAEFVERVKRANPIEDVIEATGPEFKMQRKHGKFLRGETHGSLVVRVDQGYYVWNTNGERGDVFNWLEARKKWDFWACLEYLAQRARIDMPKYNRDEPEMAARMERRTKEDAFMVAQRWMQAKLWADKDALVYVRSRCWLDATVRDAGVGFTGWGTDGDLRELKGELQLRNIDPESPVAVALIGFRGDVVGWGKRWNVEPQDNWIEWKFIPGLIGKTRLVYPHLWGGRVRYFSARNILGAEVNKEGREVKSYNLPVALVGERQPFFNHAYGPRAEECVVVEGQADAITLGQWDIPAVALAGTSWEDHAEMLRGMREKHDHVYIGLDGDDAGHTALIGRERDWPLAKIFTPMTRVLWWPKERWERAGKAGSAEVKDANDWLQKMVSDAPGSAGDVAEAEAEQIKKTQITRVRAALDNAPTMAEAVAGWAGAQKGAKRDQAVELAYQIIVSMDKVKLGMYREKLAKAMGVGVREFNNTLNETAKTAAGDDRAPAEIVETLGGVIDGWLVEYVYDPETQAAKLAYRDPDRRVGVADFLEIEGKRYVPKAPTMFIKNGGVMFPSALGTLKSTRELITILEMFVKQNYLLESRNMGKIIAYYILMTWVYDCFNALCYLRAMGEAGSGKSELMRRVGHVCYRLLPASGASTASSFFRATEMFKGTVFIDEADLHDGGDMSNDLVKFLNLGAMKGNPIWRLEEVNTENGRTFEVSTFSTFGPKLIAMRKDFRDDAVGTRSLTLKLMPREPIELKNAGIKLNIDDEFRKRALAIRNLLLRWRMQTWDPQLEVDEGDMDLEISARLNQVTMPLKALAKDDPELRGEIEKFLRAYNAETVLSRSMTIAARIVESMWKIHQYPDIGKKYLQKTVDGDEYILIGDVRTIANELMDEMNKGEKETDDDAKRRKKDELTARGCGSIIRNELQLHVGTRRGTGFPVFWDEIKMQALAKRYGIEIEALPGMGGRTSGGLVGRVSQAQATERADVLADVTAEQTARMMQRIEQEELEQMPMPLGADSDELIWRDEYED